MGLARLGDLSYLSLLSFANNHPLFPLFSYILFLFSRLGRRRLKSPTMAAGHSEENLGRMRRVQNRLETPPLQLFGMCKILLKYHRCGHDPLDRMRQAITLADCSVVE